MGSANGKSKRPSRGWAVPSLTKRVCPVIIHYPKQLAFLEDQKCIVAGSDSGHAAVYRVENGELEQTLAYPKGGLVQAVAGSADSKWDYVAIVGTTAGQDANVLLFRKKRKSSFTSAEIFLTRWNLIFMLIVIYAAYLYRPTALNWYYNKTDPASSSPSKESHNFPSEFIHTPRPQRLYDKANDLDSPSQHHDLYDSMRDLDYLSQRHDPYETLRDLDYYSSQPPGRNNRDADRHIYRRHSLNNRDADKDFFRRSLEERDDRQFTNPETNQQRNSRQARALQSRSVKQHGVPRDSLYDTRREDTLHGGYSDRVASGRARDPVVRQVKVVDEQRRNAHSSDSESAQSQDQFESKGVAKTFSGSSEGGDFVDGEVVRHRDADHGEVHPQSEKESKPDLAVPK
ncbi:hypothetical protein E1B28_009481 [Marasmius oreades]|uniref:Uncharacterized protein n=1 Tax=Marasmius oreades TaxID=181124 RepID=A0A9P7URR4_9AGAR|nr:uncharacterized protein E1B28_009481 [Marasmius oreades]KAG7090361.1 hypothetical protein E1B28_009481 [Marasmius oreades]